MSNPPNSAAVEAMARAIYASTKPLDEPKWDDVTEAWLERRFAVSRAQAALTALCALHPGVGAIIEGGAVVDAVLKGEGVVVPVEKLREIFDAGADQGSNEAVAYDWGSRPDRKREEAFNDALYELLPTPPSPAAAEGA